MWAKIMQKDKVADDSYDSKIPQPLRDAMFEPVKKSAVICDCRWN